MPTILTDEVLTIYDKMVNDMNNSELDNSKRQRAIWDLAQGASMFLAEIRRLRGLTDGESVRKSGGDGRRVDRGGPGPVEGITPGISRGDTG